MLGHELVGKVMLTENVTKLTETEYALDIGTRVFDISIECPNCSVGKG